MINISYFQRLFVYLYKAGSNFAFKYLSMRHLEPEESLSLASLLEDLFIEKCLVLVHSTKRGSLPAAFIQSFPLGKFAGFGGWSGRWEARRRQTRQQNFDSRSRGQIQRHRQSNESIRRKTVDEWDGSFAEEWALIQKVRWSLELCATAV